MQRRPYARPVHPPVHPSILTIHILAHGPFALCQAILIPIYHVFLAALSFLSARSSSARPPFLNPSTPIGFFRGFSFEHPSVLSLSSSSRFLPRTHFFDVRSPSLSPSLSLLRRHECEFVLPCLLYSSGPTHFLISRPPRARGNPRRKGTRRRLKREEKELPKHRDGREIFARFIAHPAERSRSNSVEN